MSGLVLDSPTKIPPLRLAWSAEAGGHIIALAWDPNGGRLAAAAADGPITILAADGSLIRTLTGHGFGTMAIGWSADGSRFASAGQDGRIVIWNLSAGVPAVCLEGGSAWVEHIAWNPLGGRKGIPCLLASAAGRHLRLWDENGALQREYEEHPKTISSIAWKPGTQVISTTTYGQLALFGVTQESPQRRFEWKGSILRSAWSPNGKFVATGDQDSTVHFWFEKTGRDLQMSGYPTKVRELSWNAASRYLATGGGTDVTVWDCIKSPEGSRPIQLQGHEEFISDLAYQHRGDLLASAGQDGRVIFWRPHHGKRATGGMGVNSAITNLAWSPDDRLLAAGTDSGSVIAFDAP